MSNFNGILNTSMVEYSGVYLGNRRTANPFQLYTEQIATAKVYAELFEQLLLFDKVSIILGSMDNSAIAALISGLGLVEFERALALEAIEIIQPKVMSMAGMGPYGRGQRDGNLLTGLPPVVYGRLEREGAFGNPEEAILDAFKYLEGIPLNVQKPYARRIAAYIKPGPIDDADRAVRIVTDAYNSDLLRKVGLPNNAVLTVLDATKRQQVQEIISEIEKSIFVANKNYGLYNTPKVYNILKDAIGEIDDALKIQRSNDAILNGISLPNLRVLHIAGKVSLLDAMRLREGRENIAFRQWLQNISNPEDAGLVMREYIEALTRPVGFSETVLGKVLKGVTMFGIGKIVSGVSAAAGTIIGGAIAGPAGAITGAALGAGAGAITTAAAEPIIAGATEITGNLFLDKISSAVYHGWTPKHFVDKVQALAEPKADLKQLGLKK